MKSLIPLVSVLAVLCIAATSRAAVPGKLLSNGDFRLDRDADRWPDEWPRAQGANWERDSDGSRFIRMQGLGVDQMPTLYRKIELRDGISALHLKMRLRAKDVVVGNEKYHDARVIIHFRSGDGKELYPEPQFRTFSGSSDGWVQVDEMFPVPEGTAALEFIPAMFNCRSGTFDVAAVELKAIDPAEIERRRIGSPVNEPLPEIADIFAAPLPLALRLSGNQLCDSAGNPVRLQGVNVVSLEKTPEGEGVLRSIAVVTQQWKANVVRLAVNDAFWFGKGPSQKDGGSSYRRLVDAAVCRAAGNGAYTIISLHRNGVPDESAGRFWDSTAARYKNHPAVIFGLFDAPDHISWEIWRDGGEVVLTGSSSVRCVGMQALVDTVRKTGAKNLLLAGGIDRAGSLSGLAEGHALSDVPSAAGIMYELHLGSSPENWNTQLEPAREFPLFIGHCGIDPRQADSSKRRLPAEADRIGHELIAMLQDRHLHWAAGIFHPNVAPRLIDTWNYEPTPFWGSFVRVALSGGRFKPRNP